MKRTTPDLRNRTVVITGASAGVGRAVALCFARSGATLGLIARDAAALDEVKQEVEKLGGNALVLPADVADANAVFEAAYCGAKHALRGFTNSLRTELDHDNCAIAATIVELPAVNTPQFDWARTRMPRQPRPVPSVVQP